MIFTPDSTPAENTQYIVTIEDGIQDHAANNLLAGRWEIIPATTNPGKDSVDHPGDSNYNLGSTTQETIDSCMDTADKEMLTLINNARAQARNCGARRYSAQPALAWSCRLENAAEGHANAMAKHDFFRHSGQDGSSPGERTTAAGYRWRTYGENIAYGYPDAQSVMERWLSSAGHCANLMNAKFTEVGVGTGNRKSGGHDTLYWTQDFAAPY
jgi:uncharacterized protein YkwD